VPIRAAIEEPVTALTEHRIPQAADLGAVDAGAAVGRDADRVDAGAAEVQLVLAAGVAGLVAGHGLEADRDGRTRIVEVAEVLDVPAAVAVGIEHAGALDVRGDVVAGERIVLLQPDDARNRLVLVVRRALARTRGIGDLVL